MNESNDDNKAKSSPSKPAPELKHPPAEGKADALNNNEKKDYGGKSEECKTSNELGATTKPGAISVKKEVVKNDNNNNNDIPIAFSGDVVALPSPEPHEMEDGLVIAYPVEDDLVVTDAQVIVPWYRRWKIIFAIMIVMLIVGVTVVALVGFDVLWSSNIENLTIAPSSSSLPSSKPSVFPSSTPSSTPSSAPTIFSELRVLQDLYDFLSGDEWYNNDKWLSSSSWCIWYGVRCATDTESIIRIYLYKNNLQGSIPSSIGLLSTLEDLTLSSLTGKIPTEIGLLSNLEYLVLGNGSLSGSIPSEIGLLSRLQGIFVEFNSLTGTIPTTIGLLSSLHKYLYLGSNSLSGSIPSEIGMLNVKTLSLMRNNFIGTIPSDLGLLSNLELLYLMQNSLSGTIPTEVGMLSNVRTLNFYENNLSGTIPSEIGVLSSLRSVHLKDNSKMNGTIPFEVCELINAGVSVSTTGTNIENTC